VRSVAWAALNKKITQRTMIVIVLLDDHFISGFLSCAMDRLSAKFENAALLGHFYDN
jgi:hypothetical protein